MFRSYALALLLATGLLASLITACGDTPGGPGSCTESGKTYANGESFTATDGDEV